MAIRPPLPASVDALLATRAAGQTGSIIDASTTILEQQTHDVVRLAMGSPAAEAVPSAAFAELLAEAAATGSSVYDYGATEGSTRLRTELMDMLAAHGAACRPEELLITSGGMQGLDLVFKLFVEPGDVVAVESPTYTNGTATISGYEGRMLEIPCDADGMDVDALAELGAATPPKLIYTIPTFQNPSGASLSLPRRRRLVELAARWGSLIVEDDPYSLLRFAGEPLPSLRALAEGQVPVIAVQTFSKILAPGLRVGWVIAEPPVIELMVRARQAMDTCTNTIAQDVIAGFLARGLMDEHLIGVRAVYRERSRAVQQTLADELDGLGARWTDPEGGFFVWLTLPDGVDTEALLPRALAAGVAYVPGRAFSVGDRFASAARLAFSAERPERVREGIRRLRGALEQEVAA